MLYEAALDLGCTPMQAMFRVIIPDIMPGITSGFIMALTMSLDDFVVSYFVSDLRSTLSVYMYSGRARIKGREPRPCNDNIHPPRNAAAYRQPEAHQQGARG